MKVKYTGPSAEVEIAATGDVVERGNTVEVSDELGKSLCEQDIWEKVSTKAPEKKEDN